MTLYSDILLICKLNMTRYHALKTSYVQIGARLCGRTFWARNGAKTMKEKRKDRKTNSNSGKRHRTRTEKKGKSTDDSHGAFLALRSVRCWLYHR